MLRVPHAHASPCAAARSAARLPPARPLLAVLCTLCEALHEGLAAHRHYEQLRSEGVAHDAALREALAVGRAPTRPARVGMMALYFAGRA